MSEGIDAELLDDNSPSFLSPLTHFKLRMISLDWVKEFSLRKLVYSASVLYLVWVFAKHGVKTLLITEKYIPVAEVIFPSGWGPAVLVLVGIVDLTVACLLLFRNQPWVLLYAGMYPFIPLTLTYVETGELEMFGKLQILALAHLALFTAPAKESFYNAIQNNPAYTPVKIITAASVTVLGPPAMVGMVYALPDATNFGVLISFLVFLGFFAAVGLASMFVKTDTTDDYLVAGRGMHPALAALSAVSTWNSGYMFIGFIGFIYLMGYSAIWIGLISTIGQLVAWAWLYKFIQTEGNNRNVRSLSSLVAEKAGAPEAKLAAILSVFFLAIYAAAQLTAGGKALFVMLNWPELVGILIGFVLVVAYCYAGGIRASIWTDAAQSCVMILGSVILCWVALGEVGGFSGMQSDLKSQNPALVNFLPADISLGISLYMLAFFLGGLGVAGQPQVVSRVMTLKTDKDRKQAMVWFFVWQTPFIALMFFAGLASRVLFTDGNFDAELGLPVLAMDTLPALGAGMILASIFAATMSTADSQVLACTAAITDDIKPEWREDHKTTKKVTLYVAAAATLISIAGLYVPGGDSVFTLVVLAVYGLGGTFVPLLIIRWAGYKPDTYHSIVMMISAFSGVIVWTLTGLAEDVFPSVPGVGAAFLAHFLMCAFRNDSDSAALGRYSTHPSLGKKQVAGFGIALLMLAGGAEVAYALNAPDSSESDSPDVVGTYQVEGSYEYNRIASGTELMQDGEQVMVSGAPDAIDFDARNIIGFAFNIAHVDNEQACDPLATTEDDEVGINGGIDDQFVTNSSTGALMSTEIFWVDTSVLGSTVEDSRASINNTLAGGEIGNGAYEFEINLYVNSGNGLICSNGDSDESIDWSIDLIELKHTLTEVKS